MIHLMQAAGPADRHIQPALAYRGPYTPNTHEIRHALWYASATTGVIPDIIRIAAFSQPFSGYACNVHWSAMWPHHTVC